MNSVGKIISDYRKKQHYSQKELAEKLKESGIDISYKTISAWEKNRFEPSVTAFFHICRILQIPDCIEAYFGFNPENPMAELNDSGRQKVLDYIDFLLHPVSYARTDRTVPFQQPRQAEKKTRKLRLYDARVSAGTGDFLDSDYYAMIDVDEAASANADFAVTISGDSMEPEFHDHDTVFVHQQDTLLNGEIGIFALNNNAYIKKFKNDETGTWLVSLNPAYDPIPVHFDCDSFRIFGRVCRP